ncbi:VWA domain-containing protein [Limnovirga soli]|uniref:VWA domain-containing protein n=1 Tax=Limnovirga soli TaxID=2656915 RepID=A0A8J8FG01_9BACT|nr:VWA domain-containing protein [Limnovirga soli]NNV56258.1 VWA domain-containing protein [Limnovirga soli]
MTFSFEHTEFWLGLLLLIPLLLLFVWVLRKKAEAKRKLGDTALVNQLMGNYSANKYRFKFIITLVALSFCIIATTNFRSTQNGEGEKTAGIDVMIALDVSKSMLSADVKPSRLERAKQLVSLMIENLENNRLGLVVFAGQAFLQMPLTPDLSEAKLFVSNANPDAVPLQGTNISDALERCITGLTTNEKKHKAIVLITDGEDHDANVDKAIQDAIDNGIIIYTVGLGTADGAPIIEPGAGTYKTDANGKTVISKLNELELQQIAAKTGGSYFHMEDVPTTTKALNTALDSIEKKLIEGANGGKTYFSFTPFILALAIILLVAEVFISEIKNKQLA